MPGARTQIALYRIPSLIGATASVLLAYWAALAFLPRRAALLAAALYGACLMLSAEAHLAKTDALLAACATASLGALARAWLAPRDGRPVIRADRRGVLARDGGRHPGQGADGAAASSPCRRSACRSGRGSGRWLLRPAAAARPRPDARAGGALVRGDRLEERRRLLRRGGRARHAGQGRRRGRAPLGAARRLRAHVLRHLLAGRRLRRHEPALRVAGAARARRGLPDRRSAAGVADLRGGADQAAPLRPAADAVARDPHGPGAVPGGAGSAPARRAPDGRCWCRRSRSALTLGLCLAGWRLDAHTIPWPALPLLAAACAVAALAWLAFAHGLGRARPRARGPGLLPARAGGPRRGAAVAAGPEGLAAARGAARRGCPARTRRSRASATASRASSSSWAPASPCRRTGAAARAFLERGGCRLLFVEARDARRLQRGLAGRARSARAPGRGRRASTSTPAGGSS